MYQFSLKAYSGVFLKAMDKTPAIEDDDEENPKSSSKLLELRVQALTDEITFDTIQYTTRGPENHSFQLRKFVHIQEFKC